ALLVELNDLELKSLTDELVEITNGSQIHLRSGKECLHSTADRHGKAALHALRDGALNDLISLAGAGDLIPNLHLVGLLFGKRDQTVVAFTTFDEDVDLVAGIDVDFALGVDELNLGKHALRFSADVDDDEFAHHANDHASDDLPFTTKL